MDEASFIKQFLIEIKHNIINHENKATLSGVCME